MTFTEISNIALGLIGGRRLTNYDTDTTVEALSCRTHLPLTFHSLLRRHQWNFSKKSLAVVISPSSEFATLQTGGILWTATTAGTDGNLLTLEATEDTVTTITATDTAIEILFIAGSPDGDIFRASQTFGPFTTRETNRDWKAIASSADGNIIAAVVDSGLIHISTDSGATWESKDSPRLWNSIAVSADGTTMAATTFGSFIYTSTDSGETWTARESARLWRDISISAEGTVMVAVATGELIYISTDSGANWTSQDSSRAWVSVAVSEDGTKMAATTFGGLIYISSDTGDNWTSQDSSRTWNSIAISADGTIVAAVVTGGLIYISTDSGDNFTSRATSQNWQAITISADGTRLAAVTDTGEIHTSIDTGTTWTLTATVTGAITGITSDTTGTMLAAAVFEGRILTSTRIPRTDLPATASLTLDGLDTFLEVTPAESFTGGATTNASTEFTYSYTLPADFIRLIRLIRLSTGDQHNPIREFDIYGRTLLTNVSEYELHYISSDCLDDLDPLFLDALTLTLASKLAADVAADPGLKQSFLTQIEQLHLPAAYSADAKETFSGENFGPRALASMSSLVNARFTTRRAEIYRPEI